MQYRTTVSCYFTSYLTKFNELSPVNSPFWHLESDGFWQLHYSGEQRTKTPTPFDELAEGASAICVLRQQSLDPLQNQAMRQRLRDYIVEHKLSGDNNVLLLAAEHLSLLAGLLSAADG